MESPIFAKGKNGSSGGSCKAGRRSFRRGEALWRRRTRAPQLRGAEFSLWLDAPLDLLLQRVSRRDNRPLLKTDDPRAVLERLLSERRPFYEEADLKIESRDAPHEAVVDEILAHLSSYLAGQEQAEAPTQQE